MNNCRIASTLFFLILIASPAQAAESELDDAKRHMVERLKAMGTESVKRQMKRDGRSDAELQADLDQAIESFAECRVSALNEQIEIQELPAGPILKLYSGQYRGPEDAESQAEIEAIQAFNYAATKAARDKCSESFLQAVDAQVGG